MLKAAATEGVDIPWSMHAQDVVVRYWLGGKDFIRREDAIGQETLRYQAVFVHRI